jgi:predicted NBD/HSP70 family sugar kinase
MAKTRAASHPIEVRQANLVHVAAAAQKRSEPFTRADLVADTGLSLPTVSNLVAELLSRGLLLDAGARQVAVGRSPSLLEFNARYGFLIGIDIGPTNTRLAITDLLQNRIGQAALPTPKNDDPARTLGQLAQKAYDLLAENDLAANRILAIGVGVPGTVDEKSGVVRLAPNLPGWRDVPAREHLESVFPAPVVVSNDVYLALIAEHVRGAARGHERCALISVGTGIGAAVLVHGHIERGDHFMSGQIGFMCMGAEHVNGDFGDHGCLETLAGIGALRRKVPGLAHDDPAAWLSAIVEAAERGEPDARKAVLETTRLVGMAAANLAAVVDPSVIVLGGALFGKAPRLVANVEAVVQRIWRAPVSVVATELDNEAPLWGAVLAANRAARIRLRKELWPHWISSAATAIPDSPGSH